jgi:hypothetical protein
MWHAHVRVGVSNDEFKPIASTYAMKELRDNSVTIDARATEWEHTLSRISAVGFLSRACICSGARTLRTIQRRTTCRISARAAHDRARCTGNHTSATRVAATGYGSVRCAVDPTSTVCDATTAHRAGVEIGACARAAHTPLSFTSIQMPRRLAQSTTWREQWSAWHVCATSTTASTTRA